MKRKQPCSPKQRPTKQQRIDTVRLINRLQDDDEDHAAKMRHLDATKAVDLAYEETQSQIKREFRTLDPEKVVPARRLQLEQRLEYEESKRTDRLVEINTKAADSARHLHEQREERLARQDLDEKIEECSDLPDFSDASWQLIGKFRCTTRRLVDCNMSQEQRVRFDTVLKELAKKGWQTKQQRKIKKDLTNEKHVT